MFVFNIWTIYTHIVSVLLPSIDMNILMITSYLYIYFVFFAPFFCLILRPVSNYPLSLTP